MRKWPPPSDSVWRIDLGAGYRADDPVPKRILFLLREVQALADPHPAALGRLAEALFLDQYHPPMRHFAQAWINGRPRSTSPGGSPSRSTSPRSR